MQLYMYLNVLKKLQMLYNCWKFYLIVLTDALMAAIFHLMRKHPIRAFLFTLLCLIIFYCTLSITKWKEVLWLLLLLVFLFFFFHHFFTLIHFRSFFFLLLIFCLEIGWKSFTQKVAALVLPANDRLLLFKIFTSTATHLELGFRPQALFYLRGQGHVDTSICSNEGKTIFHFLFLHSQP